MVNYAVNKLARSRKAIIMALMSCMVVFIFVWQGVESMINAGASYQNTLFRVFILCVFLMFTVFMALYIWAKNIYGKMSVAEEYALHVHESVHSEVKQEYEDYCNELFAEMVEKAEQYELIKMRYQSMIQAKQADKKNEVSIPLDYSLPRNRVIFVKQNGANGQTAYEYAYYEIANDNLIVGKANMKRKIHSTENKRDSMNRMIGTEDVYTCEYITVYKQLELKLSTIPEPYRTAIQLGALKTETILSLAKKWGKNVESFDTIPITPPAIETVETENLQTTAGGEETIEIKLL